MNWNRFSMGIIAGLIVGAMAALYFGNTLSAVLAGILMTGICTGLLTVDWQSAKKEGFEHIGKFVDSCKDLTKNIEDINQSPWKQKELAFLVVVALISFVPFSCAAYVIFALKVNENEFLSVLIAMLFIFFGYHCLNVVHFMYNSNADISTLRSKALHDMHYDKRNNISSTCHMLKIRTINSLLLLHFLLTFLLYAPLKLATSRVRMTSVAAMFFSGVHLGVSYWQNWICFNKPNFWLSLGVACLLGGVIGQLIYKWTPNEIKIPLPSPIPHLPG